MFFIFWIILFVIFIPILFVLIRLARGLYCQYKSNTKSSGFNFRFGTLFQRINSKIEENPSEDLISIWLGILHSILVVEPEAAKFVLKNSEIIKYPLLATSPYVVKKLGINVVNTDGEIWRRHRTLVNPGFTNNAHELYYPTFLRVTEKAIEKLSQLTLGGDDIDCKQFFSKFTLDLLGQSIFHYDFGRLDGNSDQYYEAYRTIVGIGSSITGRLLAFFPWIDYLPISEVRRIHLAVDNIISMFKHVISERKGKKYGDILDVLLEASENPDIKLSDEELYSNLWIFFLAGHETTATALTWACVCLSEYPEIQEKIRQEIDTVLGDKLPNLENLEKLTYLDCFIQEVLRLHPPVQILPTRTTKKEIRYKNYVIPKGVIISFYFHHIHRHPNYWPNPEEFNPERFLPQNKKGRHNFAFMPFSLGPRQCIGNNFSLIEQRLFLVLLLRKFRVKHPLKNPPHSVNLQLRFTVGNVYVHIEPRENNNNKE